MKLLRKVLRLRNTHPAIIFWEAANYIEWRIAEPMLGKFFIKFCGQREDGAYVLMRTPDFVDDYCLDVLAGRAKPLAYKIKKQLGDGNAEKKA